MAQLGEEIVFLGDADDPEGDPMTFNWDFGDTTGSNEESPTHTYGTAGRYEVSLTVEDAQANQSAATLSVYVFPVPSPIAQAMMGTLRQAISNRLRAMASLWLRSSEPTPG